MKNKRQLETIAGLVGFPGGVPTVVTTTEPIGLVDNGAGNTTVYLPKDFRLITAVASSGSNGFPAGTASSGGNSFVVISYNSNTQVATDVQFSFIATGYWL